MNLEHLTSILQQPSSTALLETLYGHNRVASNIDRYLEIATGFEAAFGKQEFELFSSPGRTEIGGNHTDHNHGKVIAGSIHLDCIAAAAINHTEQIRIISKTYNQDLTIDLSDLKPQAPYVGTTNLLKGLLQGLKDRGYEIHGFDVYTTSNIPDGAGVSSSAAFEMLICTIIDYFFHSYQRDLIAYAKAGQYSENVYWKKGSGLLDQLACAAGGVVTIDFSNISEPKLRQVESCFQDLDLDLVIVNTGGSHADLSQEYSSIPDEMKRVAAYFGKTVLAEISEQMVIDHASDIRTQCGDRSLLRALHFFTENRRVDQEVAALEHGDKMAFLQTVTASGNSSWKWLQNCYVNAQPEIQNISCALALAEHYLAEIPESACRIHGGGFAGVIAAFLPTQYTNDFCTYMNRALNNEAASVIMHIRPFGAIHVDFSSEV